MAETTYSANAASAPTRDALETIARALDATAGADEWRIEALRDEETQFYLIGERPEDQRVVTNERARVTVFNDHAAHGEAEGLRRGGSTLTLLAADLEDPARLAARLRDAVAMASLTDNPPWRLPSPMQGTYPAVETADPALAGDLDALIQATVAELRAAVEREPEVRLSSAELYLTRTARGVRTSAGRGGTDDETLVMLDLALIAARDGREAEFHAEPTRRRLADLNLSASIHAYATYARDALAAVMPSTYQGPVILSGEAVANVFNPGLGDGPFTLHASAQAAYQRLSRFAVGELVTSAEPRGDRLTLVSDPLRPYGLLTAPFDADGAPAERLTLIEDGVFRRMWADARYASYLDIAPTGALGNLTVAPGPSPLDALRSTAEGPLYEIVAFSWFNPDIITGDFVAEIKLGYRHDASGVQPIKGGSLVGNVFTAFGDARFAAETFSDGVYYGPRAIRFAALTIAGA